MGKLKVCVLFGGVSPEHEVSLRSAAMVVDSMDRELFEPYTVGITKDGRWFLFDGDTKAIIDGSWLNAETLRPAVISPDRSQGLVIFGDGPAEFVRLDCVFPALHGENGEDGSIQGLTQLAGIPCVGPGVCASAICMDKSLTKIIADREGVRQARYVLARRCGEDVTARVEAEFQYPVFVKPAGTGSSVGIFKVRNGEELKRALEGAWKYDEKALVEEYIEGREIEVAVLGNDDPLISGCGEVIPNADFYDYDTKYITDTAVCVIPAGLPEASAATAAAYAKRVYTALGCRGMSRVDFFVKADGEVVFNEINTIPGFTSISMYPKLCEYDGVSNRELITRLILCAVEGAV